MRRLRRIYYIRESGSTGDIGAHLAPPNASRTLCNRSTRGPEWRTAAERPPGRVLPCRRCLGLAETCPCGASVERHFDDRGRWAGCAPSRRPALATG